MTKALLGVTMALLLLTSLPAAAQDGGSDYLPTLLRMMAREGWEGDTGEMAGLLARYRTREGPLADPRIVAFALGAAMKTRGDVSAPHMAQLAWAVAAGGGEMGAYGYEDRQIAAAAAQTVRSVLRERVGWEEGGEDVGERIRQEVRLEIRNQIRLQEPCVGCGAGTGAATQTGSQSRQGGGSGGPGGGPGSGPGGPKGPGGLGGPGR
jgi:hypothetical protein